MDNIRHGGPDAVCEKLLVSPTSGVIIVNAAAESDMHVFVAALLLAEPKRKYSLYRAGEAFVSTRLGIRSKAPISTTAQLKVLRDCLGASGQLAVIEMEAEEFIASPETAARAVTSIDILAMNSRKPITGSDELSSFNIGSAIAKALVGVLQRIEVRPRYYCEGVITSSDAATKGLNIKRARYRSSRAWCAIVAVRRANFLASSGSFCCITR
ncbi:hypothetical protein N7495_002170 [Penicillium taxi]|uniref:uncharacterized protein n=1 Tax=Penicillium taxi TaxID=168475 RepID=UPI002545ADF5|nr:uncharacterized protein N7495_002170 [Penicillium taxi]KAJ5901642.1 hypothetical protein N7495_002170 [Penicillium taxi]